MVLALFGITNSGLNLFVNLVVLVMVVIYLALIAWTYFDARRRIEDDFLVGCATAAALFPFVGPLIYSMIRPPEFLEDARERGLEIRAAELRVRQLEEQSCPRCGYPIERTYLRCPSCRARVKDPCESCGQPIDPRWTMCPYCETPQRRPAPPPRRAEPERRPAPAGAEKRGRPARAPRTTTRRQPKPRTAKQRPAGQRQATAKPRTQSPPRSEASGKAGRDASGEDRPRPATAS
jgi:hypothetical protein